MRGARGWRRQVALTAAGIVLLAGVALRSLHLGEAEHFLALVRQTRPLWLAAALACQFATYVCAAGVWWLAVREMGHALSLVTLVPLSITKLFLDQAVPSVGLSGSLLIVTALGRHGVGRSPALAVFAVGVGSFLGAFAVAILGSTVLLSLHHSVPPGAVGGSLLAIVLVLALGAALFAPIDRRRRAGRPVLPRWTRISALLGSAAAAVSDLLKRPPLLVRATALQFLLRAIDGLTLSFCFLAIGVSVPYWAAFAAIVLGSVAMVVAPVPMEFGTYEAACLATLSLAGMEIEPALTATLLFRGLSLWLPLLPGFLISQRELRGLGR